MGVMPAGTRAAGRAAAAKAPDGCATCGPVQQWDGFAHKDQVRTIRRGRRGLRHIRSQGRRSRRRNKRESTMDARISRYHEVYGRWQRDPEGFWGEAAQAI